MVCSLWSPLPTVSVYRLTLQHLLLLKVWANCAVLANEHFISRAIVIGSEMDMDLKRVRKEIPVISGKENWYSLEVLLPYYQKEVSAGL